ncbi:MAG: DsbA family protein [bacterium]|nr:DsbA family protein [bacterium]
MNTESKVMIAIAAVITVAVSVLLVVNGSSQEASEASDPGTLVRDDSIQSDPGAKVTVVEFGDLQCPACAGANATVRQIKTEFKDRVNVVWRHFPLDSHANAEAAANAAEAAHAQGKFFEYADTLFAQQSSWSDATGGNLIQLFVQYGEALQLNGDAITQAVESEQYKDKIERDREDGLALGVNSTPSFFVNGQPVPTDGLRQAVQDALK